MKLIYRTHHSTVKRSGRKTLCFHNWRRCPNGDGDFRTCTGRLYVQLCESKFCLACWKEQWWNERTPILARHSDLPPRASDRTESTAITRKEIYLNLQTETKLGFLKSSSLHLQWSYTVMDGNSIQIYNSQNWMDSYYMTVWNNASFALLCGWWVSLRAVPLGRVLQRLDCGRDGPQHSHAPARMAWWVTVCLRTTSYRTTNNNECEAAASNNVMGTVFAVGWVLAEVYAIETNATKEIGAVHGKFGVWESAWNPSPKRYIITWVYGFHWNNFQETYIFVQKSQWCNFDRVPARSQPTLRSFWSRSNKKCHIQLHCTCN